MTAGPDDAVLAEVTALLDRAGLHPHPEELAQLAEVYPSLRADVARLHALGAARWGWSALAFAVDPIPEAEPGP
ncbi:MAG: hypothetical protein AB7L84_00535 [Acidimicrobiia bacterium]